jgi:hypothetical protein
MGATKAMRISNDECRITGYVSFDIHNSFFASLHRPGTFAGMPDSFRVAPPWAAVYLNVNYSRSPIFVKMKKRFPFAVLACSAS